MLCLTAIMQFIAIVDDHNTRVSHFQTTIKQLTGINSTPVATTFKYNKRPSIAVKIEHKHLVSGALPWTPLRELTALPQTL